MEIADKSFKELVRYLRTSTV